MSNRTASVSRLDPALLGLLVLALALRVPGLFTDLWLDEIWTVDIVRRMDSAFDVFRTVRHSNNHHLNTLIFYWIGDVEDWKLYRLHSLVAAVGSVWLAWRIAARRGRAEAIFAAGLCASSYLLIHFSSEARGYSMLVFFSLASYDLLQDLERGRTGAGRTALFWLCTCLGFLSHLMYLHAFLAGAASTSLGLVRRGVPMRQALLRLLQLFGLPALFLVWFYAFDIRLTKIGEGPVLDTGEVLLRALSYGVGGPPSGPIAVVAAAGALTAWIGSILWLFRRGRSEWLFFAIVIFASPALVFAWTRPDVFFVRYFLLSSTFGLLALAHPLAAGWRSGGGRRIAVASLTGLMLLGNGVDTARFYQHGRGSYLDAMRFMLEATPGEVVTVGGDHRFRNRTLLRFYSRYLPESRQIVYLPQDRLPEWLLLHRIGALGQPHAALAGERGRAYELVKVYPYSDLSGWHWLLYRRSASASAAGPGAR